MVIILSLTASAASNIVQNGSFEEGIKGWGYQGWKGMPCPGMLIEAKAFDGKKCFVLSEPGKMSPRFINSAVTPIEPGKDYVLKFALALKDVQAGSVNVRVLEYGAKKGKHIPVLSWLTPNGRGRIELLPDVKGTSGWKLYSIKLPAAGFNPKTRNISIYFHHQKPGLGEIWIDAVKLIPSS